MTTHTSGAADLPDAMHMAELLENPINVVCQKTAAAVLRHQHSEFARLHALAAGQATAAQATVPPNAITASVMRDDGGEAPAFCLMAAYRSEKDAMDAFALIAAADATNALRAAHGQAPAGAAEEIDKALNVYAQAFAARVNGWTRQNGDDLPGARSALFAAIHAYAQASTRPTTSPQADSVPAVSDLPPLPAPDLRDVGTKPQEIKEFLKGYATEYARTAIAARAPADSVLEDAACWHWLAEYIVGTRTDLDDELIASATVDELRKLVDADLATRKQGANHD